MSPSVIPDAAQDTANRQRGVIEVSQWLPGFWPGRNEPCHRLVVRELPCAVRDADLTSLLRRVASVADVEADALLPTTLLGADTSNWLRLAWLSTQWLRVAGMPIVGTPSVEALPQGGTILMLPAWLQQRRANPETLLRLVQWMHDLQSGTSLQSLVDPVSKWQEHLSRMAPAGSNTPRFVLAAQALGIPRLWLGAEIYQYGLGWRQRWLDSTFTESTPTLGVRMARQKVLANQVLAGAGLPVARQKIVTSEAQALAVAESWGWPVVIKPADQDGGRGVAAGLRDPAALRAAYAAAAQHSRSVLIEPHMPGRDYRLTVVEGKLLWAVERVPGGVTGDGRHSIRQLLEQLNNEPTRGSGRHSALKRIAFDDEAQALLREARLQWESVPEAGRFVPLRRIANVTTGGRPVAVLPDVHPDNAALAVRAATALRLDIAGVDLLIPDIAVSWQTCGATICEVNAQPQLGATTGPHLYQQLLEHWFPDGGRIPVVVVWGQEGARQLCATWVSELAARGIRAGFVDDHCHGMADEWREPWRNRLQAEWRLLREQDLHVLILVHGTCQWPQEGWPVAQVSQVVFSDVPETPHLPDTPTSLNPWLEVLSQWAPAEQWWLHDAAPASLRSALASRLPAGRPSVDADHLLQHCLNEWEARRALPPRTRTLSGGQS